MLFGKLLRHERDHACRDLGLHLGQRHPRLGRERARELFLGDELHLHEDPAYLAAPLSLVAKTALDLVRRRRALLYQDFAKLFAHCHGFLALDPRQVLLAGEHALFDEELDHGLQRRDFLALHGLDCVQ